MDLGFGGPVAEGAGGASWPRAGGEVLLEMPRPRGGGSGAQPRGEPGGTPAGGQDGPGGAWPLPKWAESRGPALRPRRFRHRGQLPGRVDGRDLQSSLPGLNADSQEEAGSPSWESRGQGRGRPSGGSMDLRSPLLRQACKSCELPLEPGCASSSLYVVPVTCEFR